MLALMCRPKRCRDALGRPRLHALASMRSPTAQWGIHNTSTIQHIYCEKLSKHVCVWYVLTRLLQIKLVRLLSAKSVALLGATSRAGYRLTRDDESLWEVLSAFLSLVFSLSL